MAFSYEEAVETIRKGIEDYVHEDTLFNEDDLDDDRSWPDAMNEALDVLQELVHRMRALEK